MRRDLCLLGDGGGRMRRGVTRLWLAVLLLGVFARWNPATSGLFPPCVVLHLTGWLCPGCGTQRALHQLLHGHLYDALQLNLLAVLATPLVLYLSGSYTWEASGFRPWPMLPNPSARQWTLLGGILVAFAVLRNVPGYPFGLLAPPTL